MYDPRLDSQVWRDAVELVLTKSVPQEERCEVCNTPAPLDMSLYRQASGAFTGYEHLCKNCATMLGFTIMIAGD